MHIHLIVQVDDRVLTSQLYFPEQVNDDVLARPPYAARPGRDTTNDTDTIFPTGGEPAILDIEAVGGGLPSRASASIARRAHDERTVVTTMPAGFIGHGSPMNTLEHNRYTDAWRAFGAAVPTPSAVLVVSAHWYTNATAVTAMAGPAPSTTSTAFPTSCSCSSTPHPAHPRSPSSSPRS